MLNWFKKKIEVIICMEMDLQLNNLQKLLCHKSKTTNQSNDHIVCILNI